METPTSLGLPKLEQSTAPTAYWDYLLWQQQEIIRLRKVCAAETERADDTAAAWKRDTEGLNALIESLQQKLAKA